MKTRKSIWKRWSRWAAAGLFGVLILLAAAPYACRLNPLRDWLLGRVFRGIDGSVRSGGASFGWLSPPSIEDLQFLDSQDRPVVTFPAVRGDRTLWQLLVDPHALGTFRFEQPRLQLVVDPQGTNLERVFGRVVEPREPEPPAANTRLQRRLRQTGVGLVIQDARVSIQRSESEQRWEAGAINLAARLDPQSADGTPARILVDEGVLLDRTTLTPGLCNDVLKYIAPILADAVETEGEVSLQVGAWQVPLDQPEQAAGSGQLLLHEVQVGAGPLVRQLAAALGIADRVQLAEEASVSFTMENGRVCHEGLEFGLPGYRIRTSGFVGLDESLDLIAEVPVPLPRDLPEDRPLLRALSGQTLRVPIAGTLSKPELNAELAGRSVLDLVRGTLDRLDGSEASGEADPGSAGEPLGDPTLEEIIELGGRVLEQLPIGEGQLLERLREREPLLRRRGDPPPAAGDPEPQRPLRERLFPRRPPPREF